MKINIKTPIDSSLISILVTFIICALYIRISKPEWLYEISENGVRKINYYLLLSYSLLIGTVTGIIVLFFLTNKIKKADNNPNVVLKFVDPRIYRPSLPQHPQQPPPPSVV